MPHAAEPFIDRRSPVSAETSPLQERRQFANSHSELSPEAQQLANAIDGYKLRLRRRFINHEELLSVIKALGYRKQPSSDNTCPADTIAIS